MKKFFGEFKKFITRGNVIDLAVGVIIGGAFTAIVNALTTNILTPLINGLIYLIFGGKQTEPVYTIIVGTKDDLANAIYIDWGAFVGAIINFILIAFVLFIIIKAINRIQEEHDKLICGLVKSTPNKEDRKEMKKRGIKLSDREAVKAFMTEKAEKEKAEKEAEEEAKKQEEAEAKKHTTEGLLEDIKTLLEKQSE